MDRLLLVHGAFHGAWCWERLRPALDRRGVEHDAVHLPFTTTDDDVAAVRQAVDRLAVDGSGVVVTGHSFGGAVISRAAAGPYPGVTGLVYLTAIMTAPGQVVDFSAAPGMAAIHLDGPQAEFDREAARDAFYHRCTPADAAWAAAQLRPMPSALLMAAPPDEPAWRHLPSTYVVCTDDRILSLAAQSAMAVNATASVSIDSDHSPFLSCPVELARILAHVL